MTAQYFLDSSLFIAFIDPTDAHHPRARAFMNRVRSETAELYLSDILLNETFSVLAKRCEAKRQLHRFKGLAAQIREHMEGMPVLCLYELFLSHFKSIREIMTRSDGRLNFHDALIALFLRQVPEVALATFDQDFSEIKTIRIADC